ncbi:DUF4192 domain-containing protein [Actinokineospora inagensis]|uniref:DUF4192 domain-containing protein n=1 Tax=Actinokineospora inagensis TaxID=103730 RepID=UPI000405B775|nr:DUF4192 domain-containing protein [Actinokineospora inagensis]
MATTNLHHADQIIAALPYLIGFAPADCLVALTIRDTTEIGPLVRVDLPSPENQQAMADHLADILVGHNLAAAVLVVVGGGEPLGHRFFVDTVTDALVGVGISVEHTLWTATVAVGEPWRSYTDPEQAGTVADPTTSALAAQFTVQGVVPYSSREAMAASLGSDPPEDLARRGELIRARAAVEEAGVPEKVARVLAVVDRFAGEQADPELTEDDVVGLAVALVDPAVREACLEIPLTARDRGAARLWTRLARVLPGPWRAEPAFHVAMSAYLQGDGVFARVALGVALEAEPEHRLAALLDSAAHHGVPPGEVRVIIDEVRGKGTPVEGGIWSG